MLITKRKIIIDKVRKNILQPCCKLQGGAAVSVAPTKLTELSQGGALVSSAPTKQTVQTIGGYGIPAIPTPPQKYLPTEATEPTEVSDARYSPTDCTDGHRLGGYGILPYPRSNQTIFPQNPTQPNHLCASVGGSSPAKASVNSVNSVGEPTQPPNYLPTEPTEVSDARYSPTDCKDVHRLERYGIPAIPTQTPNYLPQKPQNPQKFLTQDILPQIARMGTD